MTPSRSTLLRRLALLVGGALVLTLGGPLTSRSVADELRSTAAPSATRLQDAILDPAARGNVTFGGTANVGSYQQDALLTHRGYQYAAWYSADRTAVVARRKLPSGSWKAIELDAVLFADDSHNNISMGISDSDGRLHLALATHLPFVRYVRSVPGLTNGKVPWSSTSFEQVASQLPGARSAPQWWTYPSFEQVGGELLLTWRDGTSLGGGQVLARYDANRIGSWSYLGQFSSPEGGYTSRFGTSSARYGYLHGFTENPVTGDIEVTWTWREDVSAQDPRCPGAAANRDLGYARSSDGGRTWLNNDGVVIGRTGTADLITTDDDQVVVNIPINQGMINQETQDVDGAGRLHVVTSQVSDDDLAAIGGCLTDFYGQRAQYAHPVHHWRDQSGTWHSFDLPFEQGSAGRSKLFFDSRDTAYLVLPDGRIAAAAAVGNWTDWRVVFAADDVDSISEVTIDRERLLVDGILSVAYQESGATPHAASAYRIADFKISAGGSGADAPKATTPVARPVAYAGSAETDTIVTASSSQPNFPAQLAADGNPNSYWLSGQATDTVRDGVSWVDTFDAIRARAGGATPTAPQTLELAWDKGRWVRSITVVPGRPLVPFGGKGPRSYTIDGLGPRGWSTLATVTGQDAATPATTPIARVKLRAIRLIITEGNDPNGVVIAEVSADG